MKWFHEAADQGNALAQFQVGVAYAGGQGVPEDQAEALKWFHEAADQGNALAQYALGLLYYGGQGVTKNYAEAAKWYRKAADQDNADAQYSLANRASCKIIWNASHNPFQIEAMYLESIRRFSRQYSKIFRFTVSQLQNYLE